MASKVIEDGLKHYRLLLAEHEEMAQHCRNEIERLEKQAAQQNVQRTGFQPDHNHVYIGGVCNTCGEITPTARR